MAKQKEIEPSSGSILLEPLNTKTFTVTIESLSPLIVHNWDTKSIRMMEEKQQGKAKAKKKEPKRPEDDFAASQYLDESGRHCIRANAIKNAMVSAATSIGEKEFAKTRIRQAAFVVGDLLPLKLKKEPRMRTDTVRLNGTTADIRYRPEYADWACDVTIEYNASVYTQKQLIDLIELAGFAVGIGEWRPEKNGNFGRFCIARGSR